MPLLALDSLMIGTKLKPTVVIAEDHLGYLERISKLLAPEFEIVAVATDGRRGLSAAIHSEPDVVILDISLPGLDGIEAAREIRKKAWRARSFLYQYMRSRTSRTVRCRQAETDMYSSRE